MNKVIFLTLFAFLTLPLMTGCQSIKPLETQIKTIQKIDPFFTYAVPEGNRFTTASSITVAFKYEGGCLLVSDGVKLMTPAFPQGDVIFNDKNQTLKLLDTEYKMGEATEANGYLAPDSRIKTDTFSNTIPNHCVKEYFAIFFGSYKKAAWNKNSNE